MKIKSLLSGIFLSVSPVSAYGTQFVYHASPESGLTKLKPSVSTHGKKWVYATRHIGIVAAYLGRWGDFDLGQGSCGNNSKVHLVERYKGAFQNVYGSSKGGSIYKLDAAGFLTGKTSFDLEVVNPSTVAVVEEIVVKSPISYLQELAKKGELELYYFPSRPACIPKDDQDLIDKALRWIKAGKTGAKKRLLEHHPHLKDRLEAALKNRKN